MTAAPAVTLPGGRVLLGWWQELAPLRPQRLWFAHWPAHAVEALVEVARPEPLDPLHRALLHALSLPAPLPPFDGPLLARLLHDLDARGLARAAEGSRWELTDAGRAALGSGALPVSSRERRVFHFTAHPDAGRARYLPLAHPAGAPTPAPEGLAFDPGVLEACVRQPPEWKAAHHFPAEVTRVLGRPAADWREVILARLEQLFLALVQAPEGGGLQGFAVRPDGWVLRREAPVLALPAGGRAALAGLVEDAPPEAWREAWQAWCQPRGVPAGECEACRLEPAGVALVVRAPRRLVERLRAARSDAVKGEAWLLAGAGRCRAAARVELVEV